ncbi:T-cell surface glycoprotein CD8 alpha chain [Meriones unguiculatus]|uniref:T-cell surface glycoprotein CD8 alpha chain n=1 Tax=Meriones unguiculatus TaxID=10047 RepID=UPI000B4F424B|nr:T-cell surface glycoprotein CD8 alpha chain [Meriones unguiculatus]
MASRVACFLSLTLLLGVLPGLQGSGSIKISSKESAVQLGQKVELACEVQISTSQGCSWLFQDGSSEPPKLKFIAYVSSMGQPKGIDKQDAKYFSAKKTGDKYILTVSGFSKKQEGYYFCSSISNAVVYFSRLLPVFLSEPRTSPAPTTPPPVPPTETPRPLRPEACRPGASGPAERKGLDFACDIYIWAPLAGLCGVLLLSLVTTLICYHRNRRRVCKCPKPLVRQGDKSRPSEKFV